MSAKIAQALHQVMSDVGYIQRTGKNQHFGYRYAGEADLLEKLRPAMLRAGLLLIPSVSHVSPTDEHGNTHVRVDYTLAHKDGDVWPDKICAAGCGGDKNKNGVGDKGVYKAITGANKYLLFKLFQIETGDDPEREEAGDYRSGNEASSIAYSVMAREVIAAATDDAVLLKWWNSEDQKAARRFAQLDAAEVNDLKNEVIAKVDVLKKKAAA
jgi:hypothetical protein